MNVLEVFRNDSNENEFGDICIDGFFVSRIIDYMRNKKTPLNDKAIQTLINNAVKILNECPNTSGNEEYKKTGLVIGKVQSGKTSNFITLLALAFDNGYNIAIVIGGNTLDLLEQNYTRLKDSFNCGDDKLVVLNTATHSKIMNCEIIKGFLQQGKKVILTCLKSPQEKTGKHMSQIYSVFNDVSLANENVIIIDDEGDQATLNTKKYSNSIDKISSTYKVASNIISKIKRNCYISVTATPQANLLIDTLDCLSPSFCQLIEPGDGYCGLSVFHGEQQDIFIKEIEDNEDYLLDNDNGVPNNFKLAFAAFFVSNAVRICRGDNDFHRMLIHPSVRKFDHNIVKNKVDNLLRLWKERTKLSENDPSYEHFVKILKDAYDMYKQDGVELLTFNEILPTIFDCINKCPTTIIFNSDEANAKECSDLFKQAIFLGGNKLDRGITIDGLAITYICRRAKGVANVDNTEQRARWFGYKNVDNGPNYIDICRVWATKSIKEDFSSINDSDDEMWYSINKFLETSTDIKTWKRRFILKDDINHKLRLTRPSVARTADKTISGWVTQQYYLYDQKEAEKNMNLIEKFIGLSNKQVIEDYGGINKHLHISGLTLTCFNDLVLKNYKVFDDEFNVGEFQELDNILINKIKDNYIDVYFMRHYNYETRHINEDSMQIQQLFRGRDTKEIDGQKFYNGDRSVYSNNEKRITLQIHYVKPTNLRDVDHYSPVLAFYIPDILGFRIIGRENEN